jgi:HPt (histidine-containing phosphotransfer) domain-containing protein
VKSNSKNIKHDLSQRVRLQLRKVPNLVFFIDDSLDYIEKIDNALANRDNRQQRPSRQTQISIKNFPFKLYSDNSKNNAINIINRIASMGLLLVPWLCLWYYLCLVDLKFAFPLPMR